MPKSREIFFWGDLDYSLLALPHSNADVERVFSHSCQLHEIFFRYKAKPHPFLINHSLATPIMATTPYSEAAFCNFLRATLVPQHS